MQEICEQIANFLTAHGIPKELVIFIISMCPILECRLGMVTGIGMLQMSVVKSFIICFIGNIVPVPFILYLINKIFEICKKIPLLSKIVIYLEEKTLKKRDKIDKYGIWGLLLFVAIPLPGTGAWTGSLLASLLHLDRKKSFGVICIGVFIATLLMLIISKVFQTAVFGFSL